MVQFENYKLELQLEAQMPMIHFQSKQTGATIRASEVKPKLDRFILCKLMQIKGKDMKALKDDVDYKGIFLDPVSNTNDGLDYKMQIRASEKVSEIDLNNKETNYSIFYGNMGKEKEPEKKIYGVFSNPIVTIVCFKQKVRELIEKYLEEFFLVTNFGTMQNKGFGSFAPASWPGNSNMKSEQQIIAEYFNKLIPNGICYAMKFAPDTDYQVISENIKLFYSLMKSGQNYKKFYYRSYIYQYGHQKLRMGNEKAWMKAEGISPNVKNSSVASSGYIEGDEKYYYLRAFLGIGKKIDYLSEDKGKKIKVEIEHVANGKDEKEKKANKLERISSPIYFKVIHRVVYIVAFDIPEELYGAEFRFKGKKKGKIRVPDRSDLEETGNKFDIQDFLKEYVDDYNEYIKNKNAKKVVRINA